ncbi:nucleotidyl transferase AbiEii/AbiGii toxin family protein [Nocardia sp. SYP-A9097]|uniref:nucleotidyl transferase AbiEii/AbiGii toxin family protein n=1 Tax=Nocardia sp. SYP-A9097 TaxID=2663237 RepID=UPI00129BA9F4|nr:nucleotidyl transferase AbiEii/AbiGii toxin family protein [Nocardia sp. SYP-A9097]MRH93072.1 nucleotidyl transferase AbiEii/AbiGii toxin family protein [Nocardia sp. SYP-A9097]
MTVTPWEELRHGPWRPTQVVPTDPPTEEVRAAKGLPRTLSPVAGEGVVQHPVFDPAVAEYSYGMRLSEPHFADPERGAAWFDARRAAIDHVLAAVADSLWASQLMLRGSVLLSAWYGSAARQPGDVDFIVLPQNWQVDEPATDDMFGDIAVRAERASLTPESMVHLHAEGALSDNIWTYDRVPGRRLVLPWTATGPDIPSGTVQLDFVFNETIPQPAVWSDLPNLCHPAAPSHLLTATPELSLAWKLLWLTTDMHPQGKDFYDAVLLAENCRLPYDLLATVLTRETNGAWLPNFLAGLDNSADWKEFAKDHPHLADQQQSFIDRLQAALAHLKT